MAHEGDDRTAEFLRLGHLLDGLGRLDDNLLLLVDTASCDALLALENESVKIAEFAGDLGLDRLVDVRENLHSHQILDDLEGRNTQLGGQFLDLDRRLDVDHLAGLTTLGILGQGDLFLSNDIDRFFDDGSGRYRRLALPDAGKRLARGGDALLRGGFVNQRKSGKVGGLDDRLLGFGFVRGIRGPFGLC
jgi:hypothetical protein